jgi:hypothetical protein
MPQPLTDLERSLLDFAGKTWRYAGHRDQAIRDLFDLSATRYHQLVLGLLDRPEALAYAPTTVRRLQRLRDQRARGRSVRSWAT